MKIYTKSGDKGTTALVSGRRLSKSDVLIEAYGTVDELNSFVGQLISHLDDENIRAELSLIQNLLFNVGSVLARDGASFPNYPEILESDSKYLEGCIDRYDEQLDKMTAFILPGGSSAIASAHICRTICRRAERRVIMIDEAIENATIITFLNRLSDYFFTLARYLHKIQAIKEINWNQTARQQYEE